MCALPFFDANCMIGLRAKTHERQIWKLEDYWRDFEYYDIMAAVVYHAVAKEYSCDYGNRRLLREIGDNPQLSPQWVLLPHHTGEMAPPCELISEMLTLGVRSARMFPGFHGYGTSEYVIDPLLTGLEQHRMPLFLTTPDVSWQQVTDICKRHPLLPVIVCGATYASDKQLYTACEQCPNLHIETSLFQGHNDYKYFVARFGAERLIFGTDLPVRSPGAARAMTDYEPIPDEARPLIAGENMLRLLRNVRGASGRPLPELNTPPAHPDDDPIMACLRKGQPLSNEFIIDSHGHFAHPGAMGAVGISMPDQDAEHCVETMDRVGIDITVFSTWSQLTEGDAEANDLAIASVAKHPDRLLAYGCYNPTYPELMQDELQRVFYGGKVVGIKPYGAYCGVRLDDPVRFPVYEWANEVEAPVLGCGSYSNSATQVTPAIAMFLAEKFPRAKFTISHCSSSYEMAQATIDAANRFPNIFADFCYSSITYGICEMLYEEMATDQIIFGSDALMRSPAPQLAWLGWARIPYEAKQRILGYNFANILKMPPEARTPRA